MPYPAACLRSADRYRLVLLKHTQQVPEIAMKFYLAGEWRDRDTVIEVTNPFSGNVIGTVPSASAEDVETALASAVEGAAAMAAVHAYDRWLCTPSQCAPTSVPCAHVSSRDDDPSIWE